MKTKGVVKRYEKDDITIVWQSALCTHSKKCFAGLPEVFNPENRPWVQLDKSTSEVIIEQVRLCPSGALSIEGDAQKTSEVSTKISVTKGGPFLVKGDVSIELADGEKVEKSGMTALCRCGASANKPYCDGSHQNIDFE